LTSRLYGPSSSLGIVLSQAIKEVIKNTIKANLAVINLGAFIRIKNILRSKKKYKSQIVKKAISLNLFNKLARVHAYMS
jgi:hypothetical protein